MRLPVLLCLALAACGPRPGLTLTIPTRPDGTLEMPGAAPKSQFQYKLEVKSTFKKDVRLEASLAEPAPAGVRVRIPAPADVPREGSANPTLVVVAPEKEGPFAGTVVITSPDVPAWEVRFPFTGMVARRVFEGPHLDVRPAGVNLGELRPGEEKRFAVALVNFGNAPATIREWAADEPQRVRLAPAEPTTIAAGGELQFTGVVVAPTAPGRFEARVRIQSDAKTHLRGIEIRCAGTVVLDYEPNPPTNVERSAYPIQQQEFRVEIRARAGMPPFTVAGAEGHERYFEMVSLGAPEPAARQVVTLKLKRDAPTDTEHDALCRVRFLVQPGGFEVPWPVRIRLNPPVHAYPGTIHFGTVARDAAERREIMLAALPGRAFRVKSARSEERIVQVGAPEQLGAAWRLIVSLPKGLGEGIVSDRIAIETDDPDVPLLLVPVKADVR
jgi:hypothetical protein